MSVSAKNSPAKKKLGKRKDVITYPLILRGRRFNISNLKTIRECVQELFSLGRTRISEEVCRRLRWKQPNGWLKDRACRDVLKRLAKLKLISLPPRKKSNSRISGKVWRKRKTRFVFQPIATTKDLTLEFAKGNEAELTWNKLVEKHHYLGHKVVVGRCLKYIINHSGKTVGAICFSSAAWELQPRDDILEKLGIARKKIRDQVINNTRFLIIPNANVQNLASMALALATKQVAHDWADYYSVTPQVVETFVQPSRFQGTCYKAANWIEVGRTKGYAKRGRNHVNSQESKFIFLYGLSKAMRRKLAKSLSPDPKLPSNGSTDHHP